MVWIVECLHRPQLKRTVCMDQKGAKCLCKEDLWSFYGPCSARSLDHASHSHPQGPKDIWSMYGFYIRTIRDRSYGLGTYLVFAYFDPCSHGLWGMNRYEGPEAEMSESGSAQQQHGFGRQWCRF